MRCSTSGRGGGSASARVDVELVAHVDRLAQQVEDAPERDVADRHGDRAAGVDDLHAAGQAVGGVHGDRADAVVAEVLLHLADSRVESRPRSSRRPRPSRSTLSAVLISGSLSGKTASMTTPWISSIRPTLRPCRRSRPSSLSQLPWVSVLAQRLGAGDDFHDLLGDLGLTCAVHLQGQVLDDVAAFSDALRIAVMRAPCSDAVDSSSAR